MQGFAAGADAARPVSGWVWLGLEVVVLLLQCISSQDCTETISKGVKVNNLLARGDALDPH